MIQKFKNNFGFTVIELMVVVVIIGLVAGMIVLRNQGAVDQSKLSKAKSFATGIVATLAGNYLAEWKFEGPTAAGSVATASDVKDTFDGNDGTLSASAPTVVDTSGCAMGKCLSFTAASSQYVDCGTPFSSMPTNFTVSAWMYWTGTDSNWRMALVINNKDTTYQTSTPHIILAKNSSDKIVFRAGGGGAELNSGSGIAYSLITSGWYYAVGIKKGTSFYFYINGDKVDPTTPYTASISGTLSACRIGSGYTNYFYNDKIDDVRLFDEALSISQIQENYRAGLEHLLATKQIGRAEYLSRIDKLNQNLAQSNSASR